MAEKPFLVRFAKFYPTEAQRKVLDGVVPSRVRVDKQTKSVEIDLPLEQLHSKSELYAIEKDFAAAYELSYFRICPKYAPQLFSEAYLPEIMIELHRRGAISKGFFDHYQISLSQKTITVEIPFCDGGVQLLYQGKTPEVLSDLIFDEFGLRYEVIIQKKDGFEQNRDAFYAQQEREIAEQIMLSRARAKEAKQAEKEKEPASVQVTTSLNPQASGVDFLTDDIVKIGAVTFDLSKAQSVFGDAFTGIPTPIRDLKEAKRGVCLCGKVLSYEEKWTRNADKLIVSFVLTDKDSSIYIKLVLGAEDATAITKKIQNGDALFVKGNLKLDKFTQELIVEPKQILKIGEVQRMDDAPEKRVELHIHTNMSTMDSTISAQDLVKTAIRWGHKAVAVTDHGTVQSFPEVMLAKEKAKSDIKILYGIEAYFVDDTARSVFGLQEATFDCPFCVFDIETTGLSPFNDAITEIGAVIVQNGEILSRFQTFVNPERPIPAQITQLAGITDEMVADAPKTKEAVQSFLNYAKGYVLVAHNANFDVGFIRKAAEDYGLDFPNTYLDSLAMSRYANQELRSHKLNVLADYFHLGGFNHHRASDDAEMLAAIFTCMATKLSDDEGIRSINQMQQAMSTQSDPLKLPSYHQIILVKNLTGLKNLYKLVSSGYLRFYHRHPRIPKSLLETMREGLILGSACEAGELFRAILDNKPQSELERIASFYDYLEIQPICNNRFLIAQEKVRNDEELRNINRKIVALGEKMKLPVVATCDAHFLNQEDEIYRKILLRGMKFSDADRDVGIYYRTTEEMLAEFDYLGAQKAYEVVVTNPNRIADMIENIRPIPEGTYTPKMEGAEEDLQRICWEKAKKLYGDDLPPQVEQRLSRELDSIIKHGFAVLYMIAVKLVAYSESLGYLVGSRGSVGSSFVATMSGISEVNPLPPHYRCPKCKWTQFVEDGSVGSGYDLPDRNCPNCGEPLAHDGHDIPFETFLGFHGDKSPDIDLNFSGDVQGRVHKYTEELFGKENVFRAGTIGTLASKTAYGFVMKYLEEKGIMVNRAEIERLTQGCVGVRRTTGQHPGGIIVVPKEYDIYDFTAVQHPADDPNSNIVTTHFQFSYLHDTILKLDELGHDIPTKYKMLEQYTNTSVLDVPMGDKEVYELFRSTKPIGCDLSAIGCELGTLGLPEMSTSFVRQVLVDAQPKNFADLLQISGLTHGTDVWLGNAQDLIKEGVCDISKVIGTRDGIMLDLIRYGLEKSLAFKIMEAVRKGKGLTPEFEEAMLQKNVPDWYIASCKKIKYMFPKAHAAAYVMSAIRLGWYKVHRPLEFYAAFFTVAPSGFDASIVVKGKDFVLKTIKEIEAKGHDASQKEQEMVTGLQLAYECYARGIKFLGVDLQNSSATAFLPENGAIRVPLNSLPGLGDTAAAKIEEVCFKKPRLFSIQELQEQTGISKAVLEILEANGVLAGLNETNQLSFF